MTRRRNSAVLILIAIVAACVVLRSGLRPHEPSYQGKPLTVWLIRQADHGVVEMVDDAARAQAENAIRQIGTNALGSLLRMAMVHDSPLKAKALALFPDELRLRLGFRDEYDYNELARDGFHILGPLAKPIVPILIDLLNDNDPSTRAIAGDLLGSIGPAAEDAIPALIQHLNDKEVSLQGEMTTVLGSIRMRPELVVPLLTEQLKEPNAAKVKRISALIALADFGRAAKTSLPIVQRLLNDQDPATRNYATNALKHIDPEAAGKAGTIGAVEKGVSPAE